MVCCTEKLENSQLQASLYRTNKLTTDTGTVHESYDCDAYGRTLMFDSSSQAITTPTCDFIFTGRRYDPETGLYFYRARYYSPELGRFISKDPLGYVDGMSLYEYVGSMANAMPDPLGLSSGCYDTSPLDSAACKKLKKECQNLRKKYFNAVSELDWARKFLRNFDEMYGSKMKELESTYDKLNKEATQYYLSSIEHKLRSLGADIESARAISRVGNAGIPWRGPGLKVSTLELGAELMNFTKIAKIASIIGNILNILTLYDISMGTITVSITTPAMAREARYAQHSWERFLDKIGESISVKNELDKLQDERNKRQQEIDKYQKLVNEYGKKLDENAKKRKECCD